MEFYALTLDFIKKVDIIYKKCESVANSGDIIMYKTNHQKLLIEHFITHQNHKYSALELINLFKGQMDKSTIYRKLKALEEQKTIYKSFNPTRCIYEYQYSINCASHLHLVCKDCGKIVHLKCDKVLDFVRHITDQHHFSIDEGSSLIFGLCRECGSHA